MSNRPDPNAPSEPQSKSSADSVLRAITDDGAFRVITAQTTETVRGAIAAQKATGPLARLFADLLTGAVLVRESMSPELRVQIILQSDTGKSRLIADAHPGGSTRGLVQLATGATTIGLGEGALLQVARTLHNGALQQGVVSISSEDGGVSSALMRYMQLSEQVVTMVAVGSHFVGEDLIATGGYLVQLLPEVVEGPLMVMTERLKDFETIEPMLVRGTATPSELMKEILYGMPYAQLADSALQFGCQCSYVRLAASLATLPKSEIENFINDGKVLDVECDYCKKEYKFGPEQLRGMLETN